MKRRTEEFPDKLKDYLKSLARETARMSYPGHMNPVVGAGTKKEVEHYFAGHFPMEDVWCNSRQIVRKFDKWHKERVREIAKCVNANKKRQTDRSEAIAAKFLNTFLYQLMKHGPCRPLWGRLHLPIDKRVLGELNRLSHLKNGRALKKLDRDFVRKPYALPYSKYFKIQSVLLEYIKDLNRRPDCERELESRIELNLLWAK
jgi:hypothetical protein